MTARYEEPQRGLAGSDAFVCVVAGVIVAGALALGCVRYAGGIPELERGAEGALGSFALAALLATPGVLALMALRERPSLLLPTAIVLIPMSFISLAGATLPLLLPAAMLLVAYGRRSAFGPRPRVPAAATSLIALSSMVAAGFALFARQHPRSHSTPNYSAATSDVVTYGESAQALGLLAACLAFAWWSSSPRRSRRAADCLTGAT